MIRLLVILALFCTNAYGQACKPPDGPHEGAEAKYKIPHIGAVRPPNTPDHALASELILLTFRTGAFFKGDWVLAYGMLGTTLLDAEMYDRLGYSTFYKTNTAGSTSKLFALSVLKTGLLADTYRDKDGHLLGIVPKPTPQSVIFRRESVFYALADNIDSRFLFNDEGSYERILKPQPNRLSNVALRKTFESGLALFKELEQRGYRDKTLGDALCIAGAILDRDSVSVDGLYALPNSLQICRDALRAALERLSDSPVDKPLLEVLAWEMMGRGLTTSDEMLLLTDERQHKTLVTIIAEDLHSLPARRPPTEKK